jgi:5-methylcytosine-specific restriction endonuclease McrA
MPLSSLRARRILERRVREQDGRCRYCKRPFKETADRRPTIEHLKPKMDGGTDRVANLAAACFHCNQHRGRQTVRDRQRAAIARQTASL